MTETLLFWNGIASSRVYKAASTFISLFDRSDWLPVCLLIDDYDLFIVKERYLICIVRKATEIYCVIKTFMTMLCTHLCIYLLCALFCAEKVTELYCIYIVGVVRFFLDKMESYQWFWARNINYRKSDLQTDEVEPLMEKLILVHEKRFHMFLTYFITEKLRGFVKKSTKTSRTLDRRNVPLNDKAC